jgi:hypothetical protein
MTLKIKSRLAAVLLLEHFIWGLVCAVGTWLAQGPHFSGQQIGVIAGTTAVGAIVSKVSSTIYCQDRGRL